MQGSRLLEVAHLHELEGVRKQHLLTPSAALRELDQVVICARHVLSRAVCVNFRDLALCAFTLVRQLHGPVFAARARVRAAESALAEVGPDREEWLIRGWVIDVN